jgi:hypothetical protein
MQTFGWNRPIQDEGLALLTEQYHSWQIELVTVPSGVVFQCYPPDLDSFLDAGEEYTDYASALEAAHAFVDREIAIRALLETTHEWLWQGLISEDEYWALTNFE